MKEKTTVAVGAVFILSVLLASWALVYASTAGKEAQSGEAAVVLSHDKTALPEFVYNPDSITASSVIAEKTYSTGQQGQVDALSMTLESSAVVRGKIGGIYYTFIDGLAWTQADIRVSESLRGQLTGGDLISVYFPGGYVSTADYAAYYGGDGSDAEFFRFITDGAKLPVDGADCLLFLTRPDNAAKLPYNAYTLCRGKYSVFYFSSDGLTLSGENGQYSSDEMRRIVIRSS